MKEIKESRKTQYTKMVLKNSLIELMTEKSISKITIKELCETADINRTTFYSHYEDQYQLLKSIEEEAYSWAKEAIEGFSGKTDKNDTIKYIEKIFEYLIENGNYIQVLMSEQGDINFQRNLLGFIYEQCDINIINGISKDPAKSGLYELYFVFLVNGSVGLIQHWLKTGLKETPHEMSEIIYDMTYGLRSVL